MKEFLYLRYIYFLVVIFGIFDIFLYEFSEFMNL